MLTNIVNLGLNSAFSTSKERSLRVTIFENKRYTHRLSLKERERRVNFVRSRLLSRIVMNLGFIQSGNVYKALLYKLPVKYTRNRLSINSKLLLSKDILGNSIFAPFIERYQRFWEVNVELRQISLCLRRFRQLFGPNCFDTGVLLPNELFVKEALAWLNYKKSYNSLNPAKRQVIKFINSKGLCKYVMQHHPMGRVIKDQFNLLLNFKANLDRNQGLLEHHISNNTQRLDVLGSCPLFDNYLLGVKRLTKQQMARLHGRKSKELTLMLYHLLFVNRYQEKVLNFGSRSRLCLRIHMHGYFFYVPYVINNRISDTGSHNISFSIPSIVKGYPYPKINIDPTVNVSELTESLYEAWMELENPQALQQDDLRRFIKKVMK